MRNVAFRLVLGVLDLYCFSHGQHRPPDKENSMTKATKEETQVAEEIAAPSYADLPDAKRAEYRATVDTIAAADVANAMGMADKLFPMFVIGHEETVTVFTDRGQSAATGRAWGYASTVFGALRAMDKEFWGQVPEKGKNSPADHLRRRFNPDQNGTGFEGKNNADLRDHMIGIIGKKYALAVQLNDPKAIRTVSREIDDELKEGYGRGASSNDGPSGFLVTCQKKADRVESGEATEEQIDELLQAIDILKAAIGEE